MSSVILIEITINWMLCQKDLWFIHPLRDQKYSGFRWMNIAFVIHTCFKLCALNSQSESWNYTNTCIILKAIIRVYEMHPHPQSSQRFQLNHTKMSNNFILIFSPNFHWSTRLSGMASVQLSNLQRHRFSLGIWHCFHHKKLILTRTQTSTSAR